MGRNRIVIDYGNTEELFLLGCIDTKSGCELSYNELYNKYKDVFFIVKKYDDLNDFAKLKELQLPNHEGFVVLFSNGVRVKVKFDEYIRLHSIVTNVSNKIIWEHLMNGTSFEELLDRVPDEFYDWVENTKKKLELDYMIIENECLREFAKIMLIVIQKDSFNTKKEFALLAKDYKYSGILFNIYDGKDYSEIIWKIVKPDFAKPFTVDVDNNSNIVIKN